MRLLKPQVAIYGPLLNRPTALFAFLRPPLLPLPLSSSWLVVFEPTLRGKNKKKKKKKKKTTKKKRKVSFKRLLPYDLHESISDAADSSNNNDSTSISIRSAAVVLNRSSVREGQANRRDDNREPTN